MEIVKRVVNPDVWILRDKAKAKANVAPATLCTHPMSAIQQFVDEEHGRAGRPTNLFQCSICNEVLWLRDAWGQEASDG